MTFADGWICQACWKSNRPKDPVCYRCKTPREADQATVEQQRAAAVARAERPEAVPDIVVALPVVIFRGYSKGWLRGGFVVLGSLLLFAFAGVTDISYLVLTGGLGAGLIVCGVLAGEVAESMREREIWAFILGIALSVVGAVGSVLAIETLGPGLFSPTAIRWTSLIVFGGAGLAAAAGLVLMFVRRDREPAVEPAAGTPSAAEPAAGGAPMPYEKISDLPKEQVDQYSHHQKEAFLEAFNSALEQYGEGSRAFAVAHAAAQRTSEKDPTPGD